MISSSTERSTGDDENGFLAATFENGANSSAILQPVLVDAQPQPRTTRVVQQPVLHGRAGQPMVRGVLAHVLLEAVAAVLELAADVFGEVRLSNSSPSLRSPAVEKYFAVEPGSEPRINATSISPAAIAPANSVTSFCGPLPPIGSSTARAGSAPTRCATDRT